MNAMVEEELSFERDSSTDLKELKPKHKQICSMLAQGMRRDLIAKIAGCTPTYISMLQKQPIMQEYMKDLCAMANMQLEAMFVQSVDAVGDVLREGAPKERLQAARLQMEATKRIGSGSGIETEVIDTNARLARLAERLLNLQKPSVEVRLLENDNG